MRKEHSQPFVEAVDYAFEKHFHTKVIEKKASVENTLAIDKEIIIAIGLKGTLKGIVCIGINQAEAVQLAGNKLEKEENEKNEMFYEWNELSQSILMEFGNIVGGYAAKLYEKHQFYCRVTTPKFLRPQVISNYKGETVRYELQTEQGHIVLKLQINQEVK